MKYLVTGGCGFIGSHLVIDLVKRGHEVIVLDDLSSGHTKNLELVKGDVEINVGSVSNLKTVMKITKGIDIIYHLATQCLIMGMDNPQYLHETNDVGTFNVCMAAKENECEIVYIGTSEEYGIQQNFPIKESAPLNPLSLYALTKIIGERYVKYFNKIHKVPATIIRPFNTFGPLQREDLDMARLLLGFNAYSGVITSFIKRLERNEPPVIFGDGEQSRDFTYVSDIVEGIQLIGGLEFLENECYTINIGYGEDVKIIDLAHMMMDLWDEKCEIVFRPTRPNDIRRLQADISLAKRMGYKPKMPFAEGLRRYVEWYRGRETRQ